MNARCFVCKKKIKDEEAYTSINKGIYSEEGDKDWIALIFHETCWVKLRKDADKRLIPLFEAEV